MRYVYVDESRVSKSRFQLFGSLWLPAKKREDFEKKYWELWDKEFPSRRSELHWVKVSRGKLDSYKKFIDFFATYPGIDFRCVILDTRALDYRGYHDGDKELGFYKFLYFFISRNIEKDRRHRGICEKYQLVLDRRRRGDEVEVGRLKDLQFFINRRMERIFSDRDVGIIKNIEASDSKLSPEIQIVDILMGAVGYSWEGFQTSPAKPEIIHHIETIFGLKLSEATPYLSERINIWNFMLQKSK